MISNLAIFAQQLEEKVIDNYESSKSSIMYRVYMSQCRLKH
jgi:hypothetical protein